jgi:hypothetical protein
MGKKGWAIVVGAAALVMFYFSWTWYLSPEARVENAIEAAGAAAEQADAPTFLSYFAPNYTDYLHEDRAVFSQRVEDAFGRVDRLNVTIQAMDVSVDDDAATARFELVVVAVRGEDRIVAVGTPFQPELIEAHLARDASGWKLARIDRGLAAD